MHHFKNQEKHGGLARPDEWNYPFGRAQLENEMMMFVVYILYSSKYAKFYIGFTSDIDKRLIEHNSGNTKSTKPFIPWEVIYKEEFETRIAARKRELYLKSAAGRKWRKKSINMGD